LSSAEERREVAFVYLLDGRPEVARKFLEDGFEKAHDTVSGVWLVWACDLVGDFKARNATMKVIATGKASPKTARIIGVLREWLTKGEKSSLDMKQLDAALDEISAATRPNSAGIVGLLLDRHGKRDDALRYLKLADTAAANPWFRFPVRDALRARGIEPAVIPPAPEP
jgi:hypothetical protein